MNQKRNLEIGPGMVCVPNFETFNLGDDLKSDGQKSNHQGNAKNLSRFADNTFNCVYSSHCIEHFHWYDVKNVIKEWTRVVESNGTLEIWTVDGRQVMEEIIRYEDSKTTKNKIDLNWRSNLTERNPFLWLVGKLYNYTKKPDVDFDYQLHRSLITPKFLQDCFISAGLKNVRLMHTHENRIPNRHGWINFGVIGWK